MLQVKIILEVTYHFEAGVVNIRIIVQFKFRNFFVLLMAILKHGKQYVCAMVAASSHGRLKECNQI